MATYLRKPQDPGERKPEYFERWIAADPDSLARVRAMLANFDDDMAAVQITGPKGEPLLIVQETSREGWDGPYTYEVIRDGEYVFMSLNLDDGTGVYGVDDPGLEDRYEPAP